MDYTRMAMESNLQMLDMIQEYQMTTMIEESEYIRTCLECGFVVTMEASDKDGILATLRDAFRAFIDKITSIFRKKSVERAKKYKGWVSMYKSRLVTVADTIEPIELAPFWDGNYNEDAATLRKAINTAYTNAKAQKYDYSFGKSFIKDVKDIQDHAGTLPTHLKNYFKFGDIGLDAVEPRRITGSELAKKIPDMTNYVIDFDKISKDAIDMVQAALNKGLDSMPKNKDVAAEGLTKYSVLEVEGKPVCESSLSTLINYESVFEARNTNNANSDKAKEAEKQKTEQQKNLDDAGLKSDKDVGDIKQKEETKSGDTGADDATKQSEETSKNNEQVEYYKDLEYFFKLAITAFQTSLEDRYVQYVNIFLQLAKIANISPKFDSETGEWIKPKLVEDGDKVTTNDNGNIVKNNKETSVKGVFSKFKNRVTNRTKK